VPLLFCYGCLYVERGGTDAQRGTILHMAETTKPGCLAQIIIGIATAYLYAFIRKGLDDEVYRQPCGCAVLVLGVVLFTAIGNIGWGVARTHAKRVAADRTRKATQIVERLRVGRRTAPFNLYLRPFESTGRLFVRNVEHIVGSGFDASTPSVVEIETLIGDILAEWDIELAALGEPGEHVGAGRVRAKEDQWRDFVAILIKAANITYVLPSADEGTFWEISVLKQLGLIERCIFIQPPSPSVGNGFERAFPSRWYAAKERMAEIEIILPEFTPDGALFVLNESGGVKDSVPIGQSISKDSFADALSKMAWRLTPVSALAKLE
jgi:hypothetical protein